MAEYIEYYKTVRLHSAIGYVTPVDKLQGEAEEIFKERDRKLPGNYEESRGSKHARKTPIPGDPDTH